MCSQDNEPRQDLPDFLEMVADERAAQSRLQGRRHTVLVTLAVIVWVGLFALMLWSLHRGPETDFCDVNSATPSLLCGSVQPNSTHTN